VLQCELNNDIKNDSTLKLSYSYQVYGDPTKYRAEFKLDVKPKGPRTTWIHQDTVNKETYT